MPANQRFERDAPPASSTLALMEHMKNIFISLFMTLTLTHHSRGRVQAALARAPELRRYPL